MDRVNNLLNFKFKKKGKSINVNNVNRNTFNTVNNVNNGEINQSRYSLNPAKFTPNTPETKLANDMAIYFNDLINYAFYLHVVNDLGFGRADLFWRNVKDEIEEKKNDERWRIQSPKKYFAWRYKKRIY